MRFVSWNVNGLRAACRKGALRALRELKPDVVCLQELKADDDTARAALAELGDYELVVRGGERKGYSGVATLARRGLRNVRVTLGHERFDREGRFVAVDTGDVTVINVYMPHGGRGQEHLCYKLATYGSLLRFLRRLSGSPCVLLGDFNIAGQDIDLARPKQNRKNTMFTAEERACLAELAALGWQDTFRALHPGSAQYTWWPWLHSARQRNIGWRIDYGFVSSALVPRLSSAAILGDVSGSDHCPIRLDLGR